MSIVFKIVFLCFLDYTVINLIMLYSTMTRMIHGTFSFFSSDFLYIEFVYNDRLVKLCINSSCVNSCISVMRIVCIRSI